MHAKELKRDNADRHIFRSKAYDLDHLAIKQVITGNEARTLIDKIGMDLDKVSQAAEKLKAAARAPLSPQAIRHSPSPILPLHCWRIRVLDLGPVM
jgi:hypothetical protein